MKRGFNMPTLHFLAAELSTTINRLRRAYGETPLPDPTLPTIALAEKRIEKAVFACLRHDEDITIYEQALAHYEAQVIALLPETP
jgi:hypothetical protein